MIATVTLICALYLLGYFSLATSNTIWGKLLLKFPLLLIALWLLGISLSLWGIINTSLTPENSAKTQIEQPK